MAVRGEHAWPSVRRDLLAALDLGSGLVPPTFYHHRFLRPRRWRRAYLEVIRWFGGRGRLGNGEASERPPRAVRRADPDVLVVGGGRGGLLAAIGAAEVGARVVVLEAEQERDAAAGSEVLPGELLAEARRLGVDVRTGTTATGWYSGMVTALDDEALWELRARAIVAATGSYELVPAVSGSDRPGVMGARLAARIVSDCGVLPGERALLVGEGDELGAAGTALRGAGADVVGPIPTTALRAIGGRGTVAWAQFLDAGGTRRRERVDTVVFGDRTPNLDLVLAAGGRVEWRDGRLAPLADPDGRTSVPGLFVAGDAGGAAGRAAGRFARDSTVDGGSTSDGSARTGDPPRSGAEGHPPGPGSANAVLCFCEDVRGWEIAAERAAGYRDPELVKRRTGALTGPCQGKYCLSAVTCALNAPDSQPAQAGIVLPTGRPPLRPVRLGDLVAEENPPVPTGPGAPRAGATNPPAPR
jgi:sarcosine oxidase subunit alpha